MRTLALVESPAQLLNLLEWAHVNPDAPRDTAVAILQPRDPGTRRQLAAMAATARAAGLRAAAFEARGSALHRAAAGARLAARLGRAQRLVLGDPFSRVVQTLLPAAARVREITVVDDGTATMEFTALLAEGRPLVRWHTTGPAPGAARRATARLAPKPGRGLEVFSAIGGPGAVDVPGARRTANGYAWTRERFGPPEVTDTADLIGTSLVETGVVAADAYARKVAQLADTYGIRRYFAHRRESTEKLRLLKERTGVDIVRPELPLELHARIGPIGRTVVSFPSTLVHTLPLVLAGTGVKVLVSEAEPGWLTDRHSSGGRAARFLADVAGAARRAHGLQAAAAAAVAG